jgi:hypothetical protein
MIARPALSQHDAGRFASRRKSFWKKDFAVTANAVAVKSNLARRDAFGQRVNPVSRPQAGLAWFFSVFGFLRDDSERQTEMKNYQPTYQAMSHSFLRTINVLALSDICH